MSNDTKTPQQEKCIACQDCCEYIEIPCSRMNNEGLEFYLTRGSKFYIDTNGLFKFRFKDPCQHLTSDGCDIYDTRPDGCVSYMCTVGSKDIIGQKDKTCDLTAERLLAEVKRQKNNSEDD